MPRSEALKQAQKRYREKNKARIQAQQTEYLRQWRRDPKNAEKVREYQRNYQQSDACKERRRLLYLQKQCLFPDIE